MVRLFVNVDHVATVRQARRGASPDPVLLAAQAEAGGADGITMHLREDRRHVQDDDVRRFAARSRTPFNLELGAAEEIVRIAEEIGPEQVTLVPERREEITTEGGLDLARHGARIAEVTARLRGRGILVSLFIDPDEDSVHRSRDCGATHVELHTGAYANARDERRARELEALQRAAARARELGLIVNAGHGLDYVNTPDVAAIPGMNDLNIGHAIVARALEVGMSGAVREMLELVRRRV
ncbi:MAG: pyridoxine 5'-phosphate synthase [Planctomycetota bacterium]